MQRFRICPVVFVAMFACAEILCAQGMGGFGGLPTSSQNGFQGRWDLRSHAPTLSNESALNVITVDGTAEIRIVPEQIRLVLAITSEAENANECQKAVAASIAAVRDAWLKLGIDKDNIVEDFINVLPRYEWRVTERDEQRMRIQQRNGFRMQSNLHVEVKTEKEAMAAIERAFELGVTDIVTFDYWSSQLDEQKEEVRLSALQAAKKKADVLLELFDDRPKLINIQENSAVLFPHSLYQTYENVLEEEVSYTSRDLPRIKAYRPKMTFFHGLRSESDTRPTKPAMRPEIAVVSTVRLYFQSPADKTLAGNNVNPNLLRR